MHPAVDGYLRGFQFGAVSQETAVNFLIHVLSAPAFAGSQGICLFSLRY